MKTHITGNLQEMLQLVSSYVLYKTNISEKIRVVSLSEDKWRMLAEDRFRIDNNAYDQFRSMLDDLHNEQYKLKIENEFHKNIQNLNIQQVDPKAYEEAILKNEFLVRDIEDFIDLEKIVRAEYDTPLSFEDHLDSLGVYQSVTEMNTFLNTNLPALSAQFPLLSAQVLSNKDVDWIIFLNDNLLVSHPNTSFDEVYKTVIHETLHIVQATEKSERSTFDDIEALTEFLLNNFRRLESDEDERAQFFKTVYGVEKTKPFKREFPIIGRNEPCPCGSGKKYKKCCLEEDKKRAISRLNQF